MVATGVPLSTSLCPSGGTQCKTLAQAADSGWVKKISDTVNNMQRGKLAAQGTVTLAAGAGTTTLTDARIGGNSVILLQPLTAHAAAAYATAPWVLVTALMQGSATITHANDANADKTFNYVVLG